MRSNSTTTRTAFSIHTRRNTLMPRVVGLALIASLAGCTQRTPTPAAPVSPAIGQKAAAATPPAIVQVVPPAEGVKGIYLTGWSAGGTKRLTSLVGLVDRTELNAMVIDVKDDGEVGYDVDVPLAKEVGANQKMFRIDKTIGILNAHNIYSIARIACMRDSILPIKHPEMAVHDKNGNVWKDPTKHMWLDPFNKAVWDYNVDIALDAIKHGFKEIQFDYVRFPSEGKLTGLVYPSRKEGVKREDQIAAFLEYAHTKIKAQGAMFAADVFGLTSLVKNDEGIGQKFQKLVQNVDFLCPMTYPSHYAYGEYGMKDPNKEPYKTITLSVGDAQKRMVLAGVKTCQLRPWLQDFSLRGVRYGPTEVKAQIKAVKDLGIKGYLLWNAGNKYTESALATDTPPVIKTAAIDPTPAVAKSTGAETAPASVPESAVKR